MHHSFAVAVRLRATLLWLAVSAGGVATVHTAGPSARRLLDTAPTFTDLLVAGCAAGAVVAATALWLLTCDVAVRVWVDPNRAGRARSHQGHRTARGLLFALCGLAVLATASPASAAPSDGPGDEPEAPPAAAAAGIGGLPLPDRAEGGPPPAAATTVRVRRGDSIWSIAARLDPQETAECWVRLLSANASLDDPDLIHPGQLLRLPPQ